jgi:hypothetical protein
MDAGLCKAALHRVKFLYFQYHSKIFPDSNLRTESAINFKEDKYQRNAMSKV